MAHLEHDSFTLASIGKQAQSQRDNAPSYSLSKCTRQKREKVFISKEASKGLPSLETPGAVYDIPETLNLKTGIKFGKGPQRTFGRWKAKYPDTSTDILCQTVDFPKQKYPSEPSATFGTNPTGLMNNINLFKSHRAAFVGKISPGPLAYAPTDKILQKKLTYAVPFGIKTKAEFKNEYPDIGPNSYPPMVALGPQHLSQRRNPTTHRFGKQPKFGKDAKPQQQMNLDMNLSAFGKQVRNDRRTEGSVKFTTGTRAQRDRTAMCMTNLDKGRSVEKLYLPHPSLPKETFKM